MSGLKALSQHPWVRGSEDQVLLVFGHPTLWFTLKAFGRIESLAAEACTATKYEATPASALHCPTPHSDEALMPLRRPYLWSYLKISIEGPWWAPLSCGAEVVAKLQPVLAGAIGQARQWKAALVWSLTTSNPGSSSIEGQQRSLSPDAAEDLAKLQHKLAATEAAKKGAITQARHWKARCTEAAAARSADATLEDFDREDNAEGAMKEQLAQVLQHSQACLEDALQRNSKLVKDLAEARARAKDFEWASHNKSTRLQDQAAWAREQRHQLTTKLRETEEELGKATNLNSSLQEKLRREAAKCHRLCRQIHDLESAINGKTELAEDLSCAKWQAEDQAAWARQQSHQLTTKLCDKEKELGEATSLNSSLQEKLRLEVAKCQHQCRQITDLQSALRVEAELAEDLSRRKLEAEEAFSARLSASHQKYVELQQSEQEAVRNQQTLTEASTKVLAAMEAAIQRIANSSHITIPGMTSQNEARSDWAFHVQRLQQHLEILETTLLDIVKRSEKAKKVLSDALMCSVSREIFRRPVFAPDGQVYERKSILEWLRRQPVSPMTKQPMRPSELHRVRIVEQAAEALWFLRGTEPPEVDEDEEAFGDQDVVQSTEEAAVEVPIQAPRLHEVITSRNVERGLEILQNGDDVEGLNDLYGEHGASLLHIALLHGLPSIAVALVQHPYFEQHRAKLGAEEGITAMHIAASLGLSDVCEALIQCCGAGVCAAVARRHATLTLSTGHELQFQRGHYALRMAELHGHFGLATRIARAVNDYRNRG